MSRSVNKITLIGNVGQDPEVRTTSGDTKVAKMSLATNHRWKDSSGQAQERTDWHRLTFWNKLADIVEEFIVKGDRLYIEGHVQYGSYDRDDGVSVPTVDIHVSELMMLGDTERESAAAEDDDDL